MGLPVVPKSGAVHRVVDSTGIKVYGEGRVEAVRRARRFAALGNAHQDKTRQHGVSKRRTWRKLHLGIDEATGEILSAVVTTNDVHDSAVLQDLLSGAEAELSQVSADGAYDQMDCYDTIAAHSAKAAIPPRKHAKIQQHGNCKKPPHPRDENRRVIRQRGRTTWTR